MSDSSRTPQELTHGILGGLIGAVRHLVEVVPGAHPLAPAVAAMAQQHAELRALTEPEPPQPERGPTVSSTDPDHSPDDLKAGDLNQPGAA